MARKYLNCGHCGQRFSTRLIKVYIFKLRYCPEKGCKGEMFSDNELKIHKCKKCGFIVKFDDNKTLGSMGVAMKGTSRSVDVSRTMKREGYEVNKVLIPAKRHCQRCINVNKMIGNMVRQEQKKRNLREIPKKEAAKIIRNAVLQKLKEQHDVEVKKREQEMKGEEKPRKPKELAKALLTTPFTPVSANENENLRKALKEAKKDGKTKKGNKFGPEQPCVVCGRMIPVPMLFCSTVCKHKYRGRTKKMTPNETTIWKHRTCLEIEEK